MKKIIALGLIGLTSLSLVACEPGRNVPGSTLVGATAGGLIGSQLFHGRGSFAGVIAGALIGGVVGNYAGRAMDERDRRRMSRAIVYNRPDHWTNTRTDATYDVKPQRSYTSRSGRYCREYQTKVTVGGRTRSAYGTACRQPDGQWQVVR